MRSDAFISAVSAQAQSDEEFETLKKNLPIGEDAAGNTLFAQKRERPFTFRHTCVAGGGKSEFIRRLLITASCLYEREEACFFILSPMSEYGELLRLKSMDATVPYIRNKTDLALAVQTLKELLSQRATLRGCPHLFVVLDGLETLPDCNRNGDLEEYREIFDLFTRLSDVDVICGAELMKSIFSGEPGAFVGIGNCLITTREEGKADVTYVKEDGSMSLPTPVRYPYLPSLIETVIQINALATKEKQSL